VTDKLAPIVLFVYNRPEHTRMTIEALQENTLASESELFIYSDAAKNVDVQDSVNTVREYLKTVDGFQSVTIIEREENWGLANSIINGVTEIVNEYGKIIVLEDDLVTSPYFLEFMNEALDFYRDKKDVWHISGWNYPLALDTEKELFLWRGMNCWGWATWADRWKNYEKDVDSIMKGFSKEDIKRFTIEHSIPNFWEQILANRSGQINTWAIFWYATIFQHKGLCLNPVKSYVRNIGLDGSGMHEFDDLKDNIVLGAMIQHQFLSDIGEDEVIVEKIRAYKKSQLIPIHSKIINKIKQLVLKKMLSI